MPFLFYIRTSLEETKEFLEKKYRPTTREVFRTLGANIGIVLLGMMMVVMTTVSFYDDPRSIPRRSAKRC